MITPQLRFQGTDLQCFENKDPRDSSFNRAHATEQVTQYHKETFHLHLRIGRFDYPLSWVLIKV